MSLREPILSCKNDPCAVIMAREWCGSNIGNGTNSTWRCESYAGTLSPQLKDTYGRNPWPVGTFHWSLELMVHWTGLSLDMFGYDKNWTVFYVAPTDRGNNNLIWKKLYGSLRGANESGAKSGFRITGLYTFSSRVPWGHDIYTWEWVKSSCQQLLIIFIQ